MSETLILRTPYGPRTVVVSSRPDTGGFEPTVMISLCGPKGGFLAAVYLSPADVRRLAEALLREAKE